ncbi:MAG TPA: excinuclease ABC subunit UvrA [Candidatus Polarisedimenticolaceae bacterium]|nr:excinuclease ABC subunit UvrA [Candidatus Polarisedimenticolaceae bacterium]
MRARRAPSDPRQIRLRGVRVHNLRGVDVEIPRDRLTVITGVSGSGKSSLAFDTLYAEGRRRYVECLSAYQQQFLERTSRPDLDHIDALPPAIALQRAAPAVQARSTVGSVTEIHDHLRLLFARVGRIACIHCGRAVRVESPDDVAAAVLARGGRGYVLFAADAPADAAGWAEFAARSQQGGFLRLWRDGRVLPLEEAGFSPGPVALVADRLVFEERTRGRLVEAVELAYRYGHERCTVAWEDGSTARFSRRLHCPDCDREYPVPEPRLFSPNSPLGACPACQGFGRSIGPDLARIIPDPGRTLAERPIDPWNKPSYREAYADLRRAGRAIGLNWKVPYRELPAEQRELVEQGGHGFYGIRGFFQYLEQRTYKVHVRVFLARYREYRPCAACGGAKLRAESLAVRVGGRTIAELAHLPVAELAGWCQALELSGAEAEIAQPLRRELGARLGFLVTAGLGYLTLERPSRTLSGGEAQRIQLARAIGSGLVDTLYVLDEPSVGLHPLDVDRLIGAVQQLAALGNTVVVVEHDARVMSRADWLVDLGPGAGEHGGRVLYQGPVEGILRVAESATGAYLAGRRVAGERAHPTLPGGHGWIELEGASVHNLADVSVRFPRRALTVVTGVSGSGKSSLIHDTLHGALARTLGKEVRDTGPYRALRGTEGLEGVELVDQSPIGRSPRSNPVTYVKAFEGIRKRLAATAEARAQGLKPGYFSFNVAGGRCEKCEGAGQLLVEMHFLPDVLVTCEACRGARYGPRALSIHWKGRSVAEILELTVSDALVFFAGALDVTAPLRTLREVGLGYLRLGQPAPTLSGGEAQRLKLAAHLGRRGERGGGRVFLLDEPTTGLHAQDVAVLVRLLDRLIAEGHTVIVVEHHLELVRAADWVIDLGPGAGPEGGHVVAQGSPDDVARSASVTGEYLRDRLPISLRD